MAGKKNAFYSNSVLIFITRFFPSLANLAVMMYYSKRLPESIYGNYNNFWIQLNVFYPIVSFGLPALIMTYSGDSVRRSIQSIKTRQYLLFCTWAIALGSTFAFMEWSRLQMPFFVSLLFLLSYGLIFIFESVVMVFKNFGLLIAVNIGYSVAYWLAHYFILKDAFSVSKIFFILLIINALRVFIYSIYVGYRLRAKQSEITIVELPEMKKLRSLWFHLGLYDIIQNWSTWVDKFIISLIFSSSISAAYYNGSQNIPFLPLLISAAGTAVLMQLAAGEKHNEKEDTIRLMNQSGRVLSCIVFPVFFFLLAFSHEFFLKVFTNRYENAVPIFIAALLILPVRAYNFTTVLQRLHKGAIINKGAIGEIIIAMLLMYPLYLWLGLPGLALSFVISTYMQATYYIVSTAKILEVSAFQLMPVANWLVKFVAIGVIFFGIHYFIIQHVQGIAALLAGGGVMVVVMGAALLMEMRTAVRNHGH